jgi:hypothetical protein
MDVEPGPANSLGGSIVILFNTIEMRTFSADLRRRVVVKLGGYALESGKSRH